VGGTGFQWEFLKVMLDVLKRGRLEASNSNNLLYLLGIIREEAGSFWIVGEAFPLSPLLVL